jgi:S1-C subfamily serine protease
MVITVLRSFSPAKYFVVLAVLIGSAILLTFEACRPKLNSVADAQRATVSVKAKTGEGSGVVIRRENSRGQPRLFIWTAAHVVDEADDYSVVIRQIIRNEGHKVGTLDFKAKLILRSDASIDLALLWMDAPPGYFSGAEFDTGELRIGQPLYHVGNFFGEVFDDSFSTGVLSQFGAHPGRSWPWGDQFLDQMTTLIVPGSSGGPVFNAENDRLVGIAVGWAGLPGISFFVPLRTIIPFAHQTGFAWAVYGSGCPNDSELRALALKYVTKPGPVRDFTVE